MKPVNIALLTKTVSPQRIFLLAFAAFLQIACSSQQAYEGLKAGHKASCLEYPESEFNNCVDETKTSYEEYQRQREEVIGN